MFCGSYHNQCGFVIKASRLDKTNSLSTSHRSLLKEFESFFLIFLLWLFPII